MKLTYEDWKRRERELEDKLYEVDSNLIEQICRNNGWKPLMIDEEMTVHYHDAFGIKRYKVTRIEGDDSHTEHDGNSVQSKIEVAQMAAKKEVIFGMFSDLIARATNVDVVKQRPVMKSEDGSLIARMVPTGELFVELRFVGLQGIDAKPIDVDGGTNNPDNWTLA